MISSKQWKKNGKPSVHKILTLIFVRKEWDKISNGLDECVSRQYSNKDLEYVWRNVNRWIVSEELIFKNSFSCLYIIDTRFQSQANIEWRNSIVTW